MENMIGPISIIITSLLWSYDGVLRRGLYTLPSSVVVFWEHLLGAVILLVILGRGIAPQIRKMTRKEWLAITIVSLFSGALGTILYTQALGMVHYIPFSVVALLQQLQPIWAISTAHILLKERISKKFLFWASIAIAASYLVTFRDLTVNASFDNPTFVAALMALAAGFVWAVSTSFSKIVLAKVTYQAATLFRFLIAPIFAFLFTIALSQQHQLFAITAAQWQSLLIITFSTGMLAMLLYYFGLRRTPARVSAICELTWPASAIFIDYYYYHTVLSWTQILGVIILFISMYHVTKHNAPAEKPLV